MASLIPKRDNERLAWTKFFMASVAESGAQYGLTAAEVSETVKRCETLIYATTLKQRAKTFSKACTLFAAAMAGDADAGTGGQHGVPVFTPPENAPAELSAPHIVRYLQTIARRIKLSPNYSAVVGKSFGIERAPRVKINHADAKPVIAKSGALPNGVVRLDWRKGDFDGAEIQSKRGGETDFTTLEHDFFAPFIDTRPSLEVGKPEARQYRIRYLIADHPIGDYSDIVTVITNP